MSKKYKHLNFRLDEKLYKDILHILNSYKGRTTRSDLLRAALKDYSTRDINDLHLTSYNVQRLSERFSNLEETINVFIDFFSFFVQVWFAHTPELPDSEMKNALWERSSVRLEKLCSSFKRNVKNYNFFIKTVLQSKDVDQNDN
jgi:hypothetical protein